MQVPTYPLLLLLLPLSLLLLHSVAPVHGGHALVFPGEFSHWLNMRIIIEELVKKNHSVTILVPDASINNLIRGCFCFVFSLQVPYSKEEYLSPIEEFIHFSMHDPSMLQVAMKLIDFMGRSLDFGRQQCDGILKNNQLMATLRDAAFDVVLLDSLVMCGDLVADVLGVPLVISLRLSLGSVFERHCGHAVFLPSYVPVAPVLYNDHMTFTERLINLVTYVASSVNKSKLIQTLGKADVWLIRTFWDIDTPRPTPPNFKHVGGLNCRPDLEAFVQSSGDAGVVVVSFGSMVPNLTMERTNVIATALGRIPQKVIWRHRGEAPSALAPNIKISDWIPQNDLLGHPKTRAFVTHGGTNGLYEAVFHGVPLVGLPVFGDQSYNLNRMSHLGTAIVLDFNKVTAEELAEALHAIVNQPSYKTSMQRLSAVHRDQPVTPLNTAVFWLEFVMRHGGARHLRLASHNLNWFQYHSLDTGAVLLITLMTAAALCWVVIRCFLQKCRRRGGREKED
uniref:UDP-glucuronosyltransferase n=1 Tax=Neolamprologus brichardi TaxID=32507 RepID=A0A3Q4NAE8_NEOBR